MIWVIKVKVWMNPWELVFSVSSPRLYAHICLTFRAGKSVDMDARTSATFRDVPAFMYSSSTYLYLVCISGLFLNQSVWKKIIWCLPCLPLSMVMTQGSSPSKAEAVHVTGVHIRWLSARTEAEGSGNNCLFENSPLRLALSKISLLPRFTSVSHTPSFTYFTSKWK